MTWAYDAHEQENRKRSFLLSEVIKLSKPEVNFIRRVGINITDETDVDSLLRQIAGISVEKFCEEHIDIKESPHVVKAKDNRKKTSTPRLWLAENKYSSMDPSIQPYFQQNALTHILRAKADAKSSEQTKLTEEMDNLLRTHPALVIQRNEEGLTPIDIALQEKLSPEIITKLQIVAQAEYERQDELFLQEMQASIVNLEEKLDEKENKYNPTNSAKQNLIGWWNESAKALQEIRQRLRKLPVVNNSTTAVSTTGNFSSSTHVPEVLTDAQKAQIQLARQLFNIKLTQVFTKGLAIKYKLVDGHNQSRVGMVVGGTISLAAALIPLPGASLAGNLIVTFGKFVINKVITALAQKVMERRDIGRYYRRLGEIETMDQAAERVAALGEGLTRRYQLVLAQLDPGSLEIFVDSVIGRMIDYWDRVSDKLKNAGADKELLGQRLIDFTQPLPEDLSHQPVPEDEQFEHFIENMILGSSLWQGREINTSGRVAKKSGGKGIVAKAASFVVGDHLVHYRDAKEEPRTAMVQQICRDAPVVTWSGDKNDSGHPIYRHCDTPAKKDKDSKHQPVVFTGMPNLYLSQAECDIRHYELGMAATIELPIPPKGFVLSPEAIELIETKKQLAISQQREAFARQKGNHARWQLAELKHALSEESSNSSSSSSSSVSSSSRSSSSLHSTSLISNLSSLSSSPISSSLPQYSPRFIGSSASSSSSTSTTVGYQRG